jgi:peptidoglycan/xylan/chitin deacetylase (PgdA/CDA1 family)
MNSIIFKTRKFLRNRLLDILSINTVPKNGVHILNGHFLSLNPNANPEIFQHLLEGLQKKGVEFINFEDAVNRIVNKNIPQNKCLVAFTWDDGFEECFTKIKPVLDAWNLKAAFFINPNFVDGDLRYREHFKRNIVLTDKNPMTWEMIRTLANQGHVIGAHTLDHLPLNTDDTAFLKEQIEGGKNEIEKQLDVEVKHFAFPYGQLKYISDVGVEIASKAFPFVYSQDNYRRYYSFNGKVINRRHFECDWPLNHVVYFLKSKSF